MKIKLLMCLGILLSLPAFALDQEAERYVKLALELGEYDADYVDAYLGPAEWAEEAKENLRPKVELAQAIAALLADLKKISPADKETRARHKALLLNVQAMDTRIRMVSGESFSFAEEARLLYDASLPDYSFSEFDQAISLGCHEGYPGHHVWNVLVENRLLKEKGWIEFSVFPLFSPEGLIGEGSANYGVELAFPDEEKIKYEREVLFPLAGLDPEKAIMLDKLNKLTTKLSHATTATAQLYLDGKISRDEAIEQRRKYALTSRERAEQSVGFIEQYRSYVLNYSLGKDIVKKYIEQQGDSAESHWAAFERMLTELPSASDMTSYVKHKKTPPKGGAFFIQVRK